MGALQRTTMTQTNSMCSSCILFIMYCVASVRLKISWMHWMGSDWLLTLWPNCKALHRLSGWYF